MRHLTISIAVLFLVTLATAGDAPQTKAGRLALERYSAAKAKLEADYQTRLTAIKRTLVSELEVAKRSATRTGDLEDAKAIQTILDSMTATAATQSFRVDAAKDWQPTVTVKKGQTISIKAEGQWSNNIAAGTIYGPAGGSYNGEPYFFLEGRIGSSYIRIDEGWEGAAGADGVLDLRMHDLVHTDNAGMVTVTISTK